MSRVRDRRFHTTGIAIRLGLTALEGGYEVSISPFGARVEAEEIAHGPFDVRDRREAFVDGGGDVWSCVTYLALRNSVQREYWTTSPMSDLPDVVTTADRVLTSG